MAKEGILGVLGRFASNFADAAPEGPKNVWTTVAPWINDLTRSASQFWLPHLLLGIPCEVIFRDASTGRCPSPAIAACSVCRRPTCLNHSFAASSAQAICFPCVKRAIDDHAPKIPWPPGTRGHAPDPGAPPDPADPAHRYEPGQKSAPKDPAPDPIDVRLAAARKVLKVKRSATFPEVQLAYKREALRWHPDRNPAPAARERFIAATAAYDLLKKAYEAP